MYSQKVDGIRLTTQIHDDLFLTENRPEWSEIIGSEVVDLIIHLFII